MNTLSILIYMAGATGSLANFFGFVAFAAGAMTVLWMLIYVFNIDETDMFGRVRDSEAVQMLRNRRDLARRWLLPSFAGMLISGIVASMMPSRETVLLIAASEMGERMLNHPRVDAVVDPSIDLLTTWMRKETDDLRRAMDAAPRTR